MGIIGEVVISFVGTPGQDGHDSGFHEFETGEERLVMYADKFHSKSTPPKFLSADTYTAYVQRFGPDKVDSFNMLRKAFGDPDITGFEIVNQLRVTVRETDRNFFTYEGNEG